MVPTLEIKLQSSETTPVFLDKAVSHPKKKLAAIESRQGMPTHATNRHKVAAAPSFSASPSTRHGLSLALVFVGVFLACMYMSCGHLPGWRFAGSKHASSCPCAFFEAACTVCCCTGLTTSHNAESVVHVHGRVSELARKCWHPLCRLAKLLPIAS